MKEKVTMIKQSYVPRVTEENPTYELNPVDQLREPPSYTVSVNGAKTKTLHNESFDSALLVMEEGESLDIKVMTDDIFQRTEPRPIDAGHVLVIEENTTRLHSDELKKSVLELGEDLECPLYLPCPYWIPKPEHVTHKFKKGQVYQIGHLELHTNDVVYLEEGSVVSDQLYSGTANRTRVLGNGMLYGGNWYSWYENSGERMIVTVLGDDIRMEGIMVADGGSRHVVPAASKNVEAQNVNTMSRAVAGGGMDIVNCEGVIVKDCFIRTNDDCISVKVGEFQDPPGCCDVKHILVESCIFWNAEFDNTLEIGYETGYGEISDVVFRSCDAVHCQYEDNQNGSMLTTYSMDRAYIHDIFCEDIQIGDVQEKFIDIRTLDPKYSRDRVRGMICDIYFKNIKIVGGQLLMSTIRRFEMQDKVCQPHDFHFDSVEILRQKTKNVNQLRIVVELSSELHFVGNTVNGK